MATIIEFPKMKPITCKNCGCKYEYAKNDKINFVFACAKSQSGKEQDELLYATLNCPFCTTKNNIEFIIGEDQQCLKV